MHKRNFMNNNTLSLTAKQLKESINDEMLQAGYKVLACMVVADTIRPVVEGYQNKVLEEKKYLMDEKHRYRHDDTYISDPKLSYLLSDSDAEEYCKLLEVEKVKAGFKDLPYGHCPLLTAEHETVKAKLALIDAFMPVTGISKEIYGEKCKRYIDLLLKIVVNHKK
jgi:hypothetical protein